MRELTASGNNSFLNINRVVNTTSALLVNHTTGKTVRLVYNTPSGVITNYVDLDVTSTGDLSITPNGGDVIVNGNLTANNVVNSFNGSTGAVTGVASFNGSTGAVVFNNYITSFNGSTGAVTGVATLNGLTGLS